jgi:hypothetical protein
MTGYSTARLCIALIATAGFCYLQVEAFMWELSLATRSYEVHRALPTREMVVLKLRSSTPYLPSLRIHDSPPPSPDSSHTSPRSQRRALLPSSYSTCPRTGLPAATRPHVNDPAEVHACSRPDPECAGSIARVPLQCTIHVPRDEHDAYGQDHGRGHRRCRRVHERQCEGVSLLVSCCRRDT